MTSSAGRTATISYADNFTDTTNHYSYAFPTAVTVPIASGVSLTSTSIYDYNTGLLKSTTDPRNLPTSYTYDLLNRPATVRPTVVELVH